MKIDYTFHSHTFRCGHAIGDIHDHVFLAVKHGYKIFGASDHVLLPGIIQPRVRGDYSLLEEYINEYNLTKEKYKNDIKMYLGFECEYSEPFINYYKSLLKDKGFDYLICGQHYGFDENKEVYKYFSDHEGLIRLKDDMIKAMKSGLFLYIAHPDIIFTSATEVTEEYKEVAKELIEAAIKYNAVFEVNIHGFIRNHVRRGVTYIDYPCNYFWKEVAKTNIRVVHGGDFHDPAEITMKENFEMFEALVKECNIKFSDITEIYNEYQNRLKLLKIK